MPRPIPVASDLTVEADSGGHTDSRPLTAIFPSILRLRDDLAARHGFAEPTRVGAAGGLGTPAAVAAAFQLGAAYVVTGSVNQATVESGLCEQGKAMLASAGVADVAMAPAADMFELGIKVQVLKRGSIFAAHANKLYDLYRRHDSLEALSEKDRDWLEKQILKMPVERAWAEVRAYQLRKNNPEKVAKAEADPEAEDGDGLPPPPRSSAHSGRGTETTSARPTTRSGAGRRWAPSTTGCGARSWRACPTGASPRSARTCSKARPSSSAPNSSAASACRWGQSAFEYRPRLLA